MMMAAITSEKYSNLALKLKNQLKSTFSAKEFLKSKPEITVGVNLGNYYLKGVILRGNLISDYFIEKNEDLGKVLKKVWAEKKISVKDVRISVKNPNCLVRYFNFPKMEKKKLDQALFYELNKYIPFSSEEIYFDYYILKDASSTELSLLLAVAKKDFVDNILEVFKTLGVGISEINLDSICLFNLFIDSCPQAKEVNSCILDIGDSFSIMTIVNKGIPFLTRDVKFSTKDVVTVIARSKGLKPVEVEKQMLSSGKITEFRELIQSSVSSLSKEMKSSLDYFEVNKGERVDKLYLTGGLTSIKEMQSIFSDALDLELEIDILPTIPKFLTGAGQPLLDDRFNKSRNSFAAAFGLII